jgi:hypothetical protein
MIVPMQESVAQAAPEIEPKTAQEMVPTIPRPPRMCPTKTSTRSMSFSPIFPRSMMPPAMMNMAMAMRETELIWLKA